MVKNDHVGLRANHQIITSHTCLMMNTWFSSKVVKEPSNLSPGRSTTRCCGMHHGTCETWRGGGGSCASIQFNQPVRCAFVFFFLTTAERAKRGVPFDKALTPRVSNPGAAAGCSCTRAGPTSQHAGIITGCPKTSRLLYHELTY
jgi:hypothetical protein